MKIVNPKEMLTPEALNSFFPCKSCSNVMTKDCFEDCTFVGDFRHYKQRPGTDIVDLPSFPLKDLMEEPESRRRLLTVAIYLKTIVDYLQHQDEYIKNREYYKKNGTQPEDFSI